MGNPETKARRVPPANPATKGPVATLDCKVRMVHRVRRDAKGRQGRWASTDPRARRAHKARRVTRAEVDRPVYGAVSA